LLKVDNPTQKQKKKQLLQNPKRKVRAHKGLSSPDDDNNDDVVSSAYLLSH
jgi:hypothetical protein